LLIEKKEKIVLYKVGEGHQTMGVSIDLKDSVDFLREGGEMGARMRAHDWSTSSLGHPSTWPQSLRFAVRLLLDSGHPLYIWWGADGACLYNDAYRIATGMERHAHALGRPVREVWAKTWPLVGPQFVRVMSGEGAMRNKDPLVPITRYGRREDIYWTFSYSPIEDPATANRVGGVLVICTETSERVLSEHELAARVQQQQRLFQRAPGFIAILRGPDHVYEFVNDAYVRLIGDREFIGRTVEEVIPEIRDQEFIRLLHEVYRTGQRFVAHQRPITLRRGEFGETEERLLDFIYEPIMEPDGRVSGIFVEGFDVTGQRAAEASLRELNGTLEQRVEERTRDLAATQEQLRQAQKMEAIGQLTGGIAHDFNNLLAGITGSLELLSTRLNQARYNETERYIMAAQGAAKRAAALTHRLLAFARRQTLDPRPTDVNRLAKDMEDLIRRTVGPTIRVEILDAVGWNVRVDANQLENVLLNLCINARDAMPDGGELLIETSDHVVDERSAREFDIAPGQYVSLCVSDTGTGMPPEVIARAFDPFFTTKPIGAGTGLGLSMTYGFARQSGGQVRIYSELDKGTSVSLYLPRHLGEADETEALERSIDVLREEHDETVLVVDDEPTMRMLITDILEDLGYAALEAPDGATGLEILQTDARVDLLITDVGMPGGINGRQMADAARRSRANLKVLFITGYAENAVLRHGHLDPGMHVLTKPFTMEKLATRINELLSHA
jgi:signal transduction histidine kinase/CheY-like chemotaxis protein